MGEVGRQPLAVACGMIFSEAVRRCRRHGVVNERHQRQGFNDGEIYADLLRRAKLLQHEYIGVGQQGIKLSTSKIGNETESQPRKSWTFGPDATIVPDLGI